MRKAILWVTSLILFIASVSAQNRTVKGIVLDETGTPVPYASVVIKGTATGTMANFEGNFEIQISPGSTLTVSSQGFIPFEIVVGNEDFITATLRATGQLKEVVVTALGVKTSKDRLGTSQSTVGGNDLVKSGETSVLNAMASKASGVQVVRSTGDPGAGTYIQIRGQSTITGDLQPLFVIDGIPVSNSSLGGEVDGVAQQSRMGDFNADDIDNIEILKGAAAAVLYGTRAANGVVLITTKKGKAGRKINVSFSSTYSVDALNKSVPLQKVYGLGNNGIFQYGASSNNRAWGDKIADRAGGEDVFLTSGAHAILPDGSTRYLIQNGTAADPHGGKRSRDVYDHSKDLFENGYYWDNTVSLSGGDERGVFYASFSTLKQDGILKAGSDYNRKTFRINADRKFGALKLAGGFAYTNSTSDRAQQGSNISGIFLGGLRTSPDFDNNIFEGTYVDASGAIFLNRQISYRNPIGARTNSGYDNPFWILNRIKNTSAVNRITANFEATLKPTSWLTIVERAGVDNYADKRLGNFPTLSSAFPNGQLTMETISETQFNNDLFARGEFSIGQNLELSALAGWNFNHRIFDNVGATVRNFINEDILNPIFDLGNSAADARFPFNEQSYIRTTAGFAQLSFNAYDQLFVELTGRHEAASTFRKEFFYPSASVAWQFGKLVKSGFLSFGKLRASYGEVGVQPRPYLLSTYYVPQVVPESWGPQLDASSASYGGGFARSAVKGNPDLKPERKSELEFGADLRLFDNIISLSGTYYQNKTKDAIFAIQVPATTGYTNTNGNAAEIENKGFELDLGVSWIRKQDFTFSTNAIFSRNRNKVLSLLGAESFFLNGFTGGSSRAVAGMALGTLWGGDFLRDEKGALILDAEGFPQNSGVEGPIGDPNPDWTGGITNTLTWKNFRLSVLVDHVQGGAVWNGTKGALYVFGTHAETGNEVVAPTDLTTYYGNTIAAGTPFRGAIHDFGAGNVALNQEWYTDLGGGFGPVASQFIEDGTRTRLREISLGYTISGENFTRRTKLQSIDISVAGRNLALWTRYTGIDPETNLTGPSNGRGLDYFNNPSTRSYLFTIRINY